MDATQCSCWLSCDHASYDVMQIQASLVSFGGIAGLFLGYSLIVTIEIGYYFTLRTYCGAVVQSSREQHRIVTIHVVEKIPRNVDVNQMYYPYVD